DGLGVCYLNENKLKKSEEMYKKVIELNPENSGNYADLGHFYNGLGDYEKAEEMFKRAIGLNLNEVSAYDGLGVCYLKENKIKKAEEVYKKAKELNPKNSGNYADLGYLYNRLEEYVKAEEMFKKAIELNPDSAGICFSLGACYFEQKKYNLAQKMYNKAIELNPTMHYEYFYTGKFFYECGEYSIAKEILEKVIEVSPEIHCDRIYGLLATINQIFGNHQLANKYFQKANDFRRKHCNSMTKRNYPKIKDIVLKNNIKLVCMQYPVRRIDSLKNLLDSEEGIIFVDNEKVFKDAFKNGNYKDYFEDNCAGDFGHCTSKGNKLLAENVAKVLLDEVFNK
ncbi:MAG: tetratricopeptide repeat protein, partial [Candidatus Omnitrophica bacterium]|nr:tetratricopeptide repeat protein [Candidatus Omnitrophota bacterium]